MPAIFNYPNEMSPMDTTNLQLEWLQLAGRTLDMQIVAENSAPSFVEVTGVAQQNCPTVSGLNDYDYQNLVAVLGHQNLSLLKCVNKVPLPPEIMDHFTHMQRHCLMGIFPEISRAWLTIDSDIYVWAYEHGTDVAYYDSLGETIISVGLATPKPGVFQTFVRHLLVLTTTVEIVVLGVTFSGGNSPALGSLEEMNLIPEPVFVLPTDGVSMMVIQATAGGRIFMGGKDGCLYEITYQARLGWFGKHCKKVNHSTSALSFLVPSFLNVALYEDDPIVKIEVDNSRHILFTLSEKGNIEMFDLGEQGDSLSRVLKVSQNKIMHIATDVVKTLESATFRPIISISAVEKFESEHLNLVAVTQTGVRLYFTAGCICITPTGTVAQRPICLSLLHVRLPPGFAANSALLKPRRVQRAAYEGGALLMVSLGAGEGEALWGLSGAAWAGAGARLREAPALLPLDGPAWALRPLPDARTSASKVRGISEEGRRWCVLWAGGALIVRQLGAADILRALLLDHGPDSPQVKAFFQMQTEEAACACALRLACPTEEGGEDPRVADGASRAFFQCGGRQRAAGGQPSPGAPFPASPPFSPHRVSTPLSGRSAATVHRALQAVRPPARPPAPPGRGLRLPGQERGSPPGMPPSVARSPALARDALAFRPFPDRFSPRHDGLYVYVGRILRPIWQMKCVTKTTRDGKDVLASTINSNDCLKILKNLYGAKSFLERNSLGIAGSQNKSMMSMIPDDNANNSIHNMDVHMEEQQSLVALKVFVNTSCEILSLWKVVVEHQFHVITATLPADQQEALQAASFRELMVAGQEVASLLIYSLINQYLTDNASVDSISEKLREVCPSLYRREDAACSKANEILLFAKQQPNKAEREEMLCSALKLCKDVTPQINLPAICARLISAGYWAGVVELCTVTAERLDPMNAALHHYKSGRPAHDREGCLAYYKRMEVYRQVTNALERLYERSISVAGSQGSAVPAATLAADLMLSLSPQDANEQLYETVSRCVSTSDELLHVAAYEWLAARRLHGPLAALTARGAASLRGFLARAAAGARGAEAAAAGEMLWKLLEADGDRAAAARVLEDLASRPGTQVPLEQRLRYLSQAVVCIRGAEGGAGAAALARRLEEALEVGALQAALLAELRARQERPPPALLRRLDDELLDLTRLYEEAAAPHRLWESQLAILQCAERAEPLLLEAAWAALLREEAEAARGRPPPEAAAALCAKVAALARRHSVASRSFPLEHIVRWLEVQCCKLGVSASPPAKTLLEIGVPYDQLIDVYTKLIGMNERIWISSGRELYIVDAAIFLMDTFVKETNALGVQARRRALVKCQDLVSTCLNTLYSKPDTQERVNTLRGIQSKLDRLE